MLKLIVLFVVFSTRRIHVQSECDFPDKFEGHMTTERISFFAGEEPDLAREEVRFGYDALYRRSYQRLFFTSKNNTQEEVLTLTFEGKNVTYTVENGKCTKSPSGPWMKLGVPSDAVKVGAFYIGPLDGTLMTEYKMPGDETLKTHMHLVVAPDCIPVTMKQVILFDKGGFTSLVTFKNITVGIWDDRVFELPEMCSHARETD